MAVSSTPRLELVLTSYREGFEPVDEDIFHAFGTIPHPENCGTVWGRRRGAGGAGGALAAAVIPKKERGERDNSRKKELKISHIPNYYAFIFLKYEEDGIS